MSLEHVPVLVREVLEVFSPLSLPRFFEGTVGAGGHARAILEAHPEVALYFACDRDLEAHALAKRNLESWEKKIRWIHGPFGELKSYLEGETIDGFLFDVGVSSMQIDQGERGFSFQKEGPLDMRMDPTTGKSAEELLFRLPEKELSRIFFEYGEERRARQVAKAIVEVRKKKRLKTTSDLIRVLEPVLGKQKGKIHPATRVFQGLRIAVNDELGELRRGVEAALEALVPGGRGAVITFHSLEDRIVKELFKNDPSLTVLTKKPLVASLEEQKKNRRSRSAKLRAVERRL